jgi:hypothetical protein
VLVMACVFHNFFHWVPGPMAKAFSEEFVALVAIATEPNSIRFRGMTFVMGKASAEWVEPMPETSEDGMPEFAPETAPGETGSGPKYIRLDSEG